MAKPVLLDTSVWIAYLRKEKATFAEVDKLIDSKRVRLLGLVLAELYQGCKTEKELSVIHDTAKIFPRLEETPEMWEQAGILSFNLRRQGKSPGLADCYIATVVQKAGVLLYSHDKHFSQLARACKVSMYQPSAGA